MGMEISTFDGGSGGYMSAGSLTVYNYFRFFNGSTWYASGGTVHCGGTSGFCAYYIQNNQCVFS